MNCFLNAPKIVFSLGEVPQSAVNSTFLDTLTSIPSYLNSGYLSFASSLIFQLDITLILVIPLEKYDSGYQIPENVMWRVVGTRCLSK